MSSMRYFLSICTAAVFTLCFTPVMVLGSESSQGHFEFGERLAVSLHPMYESNYFAEGRDELNGDSLLSGSLEVEITLPVGAALVGTWYGFSDEADYREGNYYATFTVEYENLTWDITYNHLEFYSDDTDDDELGASLTWTPTNQFEAGIEWYMSFRADGSFYQAYIASPQQAGVVSWVPSLEFGINDGYREEGHDGPNNFAARLDAEWQISKGISLTGYVAHTWAVDREPVRYADDELLKDFAFGGIGISLTY